MTSNPSTPDTDGPKTETTLTTRIRINIPGSRPIPPVVVRKPVAAAEAEAEPARTEPAAGPAASAAPAEPAEPEEPAPAANNWFAPRKSGPAAPAPAPRSQAPALPSRTPAAAGPAAAPPGRTPSAPAPGPLPVRTPAPPGVPGARGGAPAAGFAPGAPAPAPAGPRPGAPAGPGFDAPGRAGMPPAPQPPAHGGPGGPGAGPGLGGPGPAGPLGGPGVGATQGFPAFPGDPDTGPATEAFPAFDAAFDGPAGPAGPAGPTGGPALGTFPVDAPRADEAARWPGPELDEPRPTPVPAPAPPAPGPRAPKPSAAKPAPKPTKVTKARSKLVLIGGGLIALVGVAYGAGLLLNHSDVPKGTTVLGVDISGSRDEAVAKIQAAFGGRAAAPLQLTVGGKQVELKPEKAGLSLDAQTTVRNAAGSDYNPVTVIGSLIGQERIADPVIPVDEEKLQVALQELAGTAGTATEGTIKFDTGKAVAVPGKAGTTLDAGASADLVTKAFRTMVATGKASPVDLPVTTKEPAITQAELDRAMKEFAEPAMSGVATVKAGTKSLPFGPKSLPKILSMQAVDGHLVEKYDLEALKATYGNSFDGVLITRGTGEKTPVTPQDVAGALGKALRGKTPAERTATIDTNPS
ncbi:hypothetical protein ABZ924_28880 [Streptomyces sp. NPDC046876]|uniref:hypothetical protein n=1 Tax=Streptomyces sp. NPDC046876 TaxID=3155616 RepID=UPI0033E12660